MITGLEIAVDSKIRFVGKVGKCPPCDIPHLEGRIILYKKDKWTNVISYALNAFGIDRAAYEYARDNLGAEGVVCFCPDRRCTILVSNEKMKSAYTVNLGERGQLRVPVRDIKIVENTNGINFKYTNHTILIQ
jgi:hypothetical protein